MGFIQGLGTGLMWVPLSVVTFATLAPEKLPEAAALFHLLRNFGSSIFISLSVMAAVRTGRISYAELSEHISALRETSDATMGDGAAVPRPSAGPAGAGRMRSSARPC